MVEDLTHSDISIQPKEWLTHTEKQRYDKVESIYIVSRRCSALLAELNCLMDNTEKPCPRTPHCFSLLGESGVGKTTLVRTWMWNATTLEAPPLDKRTAPYLYVCLPASATPKGIMAACLDALGCQEFSLRGELEMMRRLLAELRTVSVRILCIDNLEHLINRENRHIRCASLEVLEDLVLLSGISTIFVGMLGEAESVVQMSRRLDALTGAPRILQPFEWDPTRPETVNEFRTLLSSIDQALPFEHSGLDAEELANAIWYATEGILGRIMILLRNAALRAIRSGAMVISSSLLAQAYDACIDGTRMGVGKINPFLVPTSCDEQWPPMLDAGTRPRWRKGSKQHRGRRGEKKC